jgi:hypothetical protein
MQRELEQQGSRQFDVLAVDAFSSDSIPVHLLTRECFDLYWRHLQRNGVLAVHVSNRHLDLAPVVGTLARLAGREARVTIHRPTEESSADDDFRSDWVLATEDRAFLSGLPGVRGSRGGLATETLPNVLWTDDFSSLLSVLR